MSTMLSIYNVGEFNINTDGCYKYNGNFVALMECESWRLFFSRRPVVLRFDKSFAVLTTAFVKFIKGIVR